MVQKSGLFQEQDLDLTNEKPADSPSYGQNSFLIVDDELHTREICCDFLEEGQFKVESASNGKEALEILSKKNFQILLSDIQMPEMDGIDLLKESRRLYPEMDVILMTAYGGLPTAIEAIRFGAYDYITKPFSRDFLMNRVHKCLEKSELQKKLKESQEKLIEQEKLAALGGVASWLSHRMRNSLSVISMCAHYLKGKKYDSNAAEPDEVIGAIINKTKVLEKITSDLITYSRSYVLQKNMEDINQILEEAVQSLLVQIQIQKVELIKKLAEGIPSLACDPHTLHEAFENILVNALHAIGSQEKEILFIKSEFVPEISNEEFPKKGKIIVSITNSGSIIPPENREKIFMPFFTTKENGSGLGLAITRRIVEQHGGEVFVESGERSLPELGIKELKKITTISMNFAITGLLAECGVNLP